MVTIGNWLMLVLFGCFLVGMPALVFVGRHVLPLRMWFGALWFWIAALGVVLVAAERLATYGSGWHFLFSLSGTAVMAVFLSYSVAFGVGLGVRSIVVHFRGVKS